MMANAFYIEIVISLTLVMLKSMLDMKCYWWRQSSGHPTPNFLFLSLSVSWPHTVCITRRRRRKEDILESSHFFHFSWIFLSKLLLTCRPFWNGSEFVDLIYLVFCKIFELKLVLCYVECWLWLNGFFVKFVEVLGVKRIILILIAIDWLSLFMVELNLIWFMVLKLTWSCEGCVPLSAYVYFA